VTKKPEELTEEELAKAHGEELPDREALSVLHGGLDYPLPVDDTYPHDPSPPRGGVIPLEEPTPE
jgi:hypothetical protein